MRFDIAYGELSERKICENNIFPEDFQISSYLENGKGLNEEDFNNNSTIETYFDDIRELEKDLNGSSYEKDIYGNIDDLYFKYFDNIDLFKNREINFRSRLSNTEQLSDIESDILEKNKAISVSNDLVVYTVCLFEYFKLSEHVFNPMFNDILSRASDKLDMDTYSLHKKFDEINIINPNVLNGNVLEDFLSLFSEKYISAFYTNTMYYNKKLKEKIILSFNNFYENSVNDEDSDKIIRMLDYAEKDGKFAFVLFDMLADGIEINVSDTDAEKNQGDIYQNLENQDKKFMLFQKYNHLKSLGKSIEISGDLKIPLFTRESIIVSVKSGGIIDKTIDELVSLQEILKQQSEEYYDTQKAYD
ncbi:MAG: hypothetical protein KAR23_03330 [Candidatus Aenigmarchaeota archaeon]|nr:hypothetical protein [Candidatus Aenigmarchaeota archaeon]